MRLRMLIVVASALAFVVLGPTAALAGSRPRVRVVHGTSSITSTLNANTLSGSNQGTVHLDHIGTFTTVGTITSFSYTSTSFTSSGTTTYTTKKGAQLFGTFETSATLTGTALGDTGTFTTVTTITGGTRRFAHASGTLTAVGTYVIVSDVDNVVTSDQTAKISGTLSH